MPVRCANVVSRRCFILNLSARSSVVLYLRDHCGLRRLWRLGWLRAGRRRLRFRIAVCAFCAFWACVVTLSSFRFLYCEVRSCHAQEQQAKTQHDGRDIEQLGVLPGQRGRKTIACLLYTSDAADE